MKNKEGRIAAALNSKYSNLQIWHYKGGNCALLEEELVQSKPPHDDIKDCLASCVEIAVAPTMSRKSSLTARQQVTYHSRFGGIF
jgi:hypothetical protein